ncbi:Cin10p PWA37_001485 [Arxiozyma heterogenica]|uniref:Major facilitator superfamily (MFS) profile domain-containing protein n=1 Tax=Arxiozyma heterogenica TaxID=278026 RepID=A0AAN8A8X2_9SACH|nr:hypothetical protein RI543_002678 [Kazachstania heterogenica]
MDQSTQGCETEDIYCDCYSTLSQITSTTINDIDSLPYNFNLRTVLILVGATVGGLLFGYDTGVISGVLINLKADDLNRADLTDWHKEIITSITSVGSFLGSILAFPLADKFGRKISMSICCIIFILAAFWMGFSITLSWLIIGRFIVGIAIGISAQCVPIYLTEISPARIRATILVLNSIAITGGQLLAYLIAFGFDYRYYNIENKQFWRVLFMLSCVPAFFFLLILDFIPESPRWLVMQKKYKEALMVLDIVYPKADTYQLNLILQKIVNDLSIIYKYQDKPELNRIHTTHLKRNSVYDQLVTTIVTRNENMALSFSDIVDNSADSSTESETTPLQNNKKHYNRKKQRHRMEPKAKRALFVGCTLMFFQQITGFNAFMYYSPIIFQRFDSINNPILPSIIVALINFIFTFLALKYVDIYGKRLMLLYTIWIMTFGLLLSTMGFARNNVTILIVSITIFVGGYALGMGSIPWSSVEFLPLNRRSFGASCISCTNWLTNFLISSTFLSLLDKVGDEDLMLLFAIFTIFTWLFVYFCYPEVKGLTLEEIGKVYENGIDVHYIYRNYH